MLFIDLADALEENIYFAIAEKSREKIHIFSEKEGCPNSKLFYPIRILYVKI